MPAKWMYVLQVNHRLKLAEVSSFALMFDKSCSQIHVHTSEKAEVEFINPLFPQQFFLTHNENPAKNAR